MNYRVGVPISDHFNGSDFGAQPSAVAAVLSNIGYSSSTADVSKDCPTCPFRRADLDEVERLGEHDDAGRPLLPHHPPEVVEGAFVGALRHDVGVRFQQTLP